MEYTLFLFVHLLSTAVMFGIVWFVQIIHYPLFAVVEEKNFSLFEKEHVRLTKFLIMPAMLLELGTGILLPFLASSELLDLYWFNLLLLLGIWVSTFLIQVPLHSTLTAVKDNRVIRRLVQSNWIMDILLMMSLVN